MAESSESETDQKNEVEPTDLSEDELQKWKQRD